MYFVYIMTNHSKTLYTGVTNISFEEYASTRLALDQDSPQNTGWAD